MIEGRPACALPPTLGNLPHPILLRFTHYESRRFPQRLHVTGALTLASSATLGMGLDGTTAGTLYHQVSVTGAVSLTGSTLSLSGSYTPGVSDSFTLIDNDGADAVTGTFSGLAEGATVTFNGQTLRITYVGGTGNDVVLSAANDAPVNSVPGAQASAEDTNLVFSTGNLNAISVSDVDAGASPVQVSLSATNGTLSLAGTTGLTFSVGDGAAASMTFTAPLQTSTRP